MRFMDLHCAVLKDVESGHMSQSGHHRHHEDKHHHFYPGSRGGGQLEKTRTYDTLEFEDSLRGPVTEAALSLIVEWSQTFPIPRCSSVFEEEDHGGEHTVCTVLE
jgi:hypothetical protein